MDSGYHTRSDSDEVQKYYKAQNFMNSAGIQLRLAKAVLGACPAVSKVIFGIARSDYSVDFYRMPSGEIREGIYIDCNPRDRDPATTLLWGFYGGC